MYAQVLTGLRQYEVGKAYINGDLTVYPLISGVTPDPRYLILDVALERGLVTVGEVSDGGAVPELLLKNIGDFPVFLLDGEELVGARQDRVLNVTVLAPPATELRLPVSCVERGRWAYKQRDFTTSPNTLHSEARAAKAARVSRSLRHSGGRDGGQGEIWQHLSRKSGRMGSASSTEAMSDLYAKFSSTVASMVAGMPLLAGQVGAVFAVRGQLRGLEVFEHPRIAAPLLGKVARSYALDAADPQAYRGTTTGQPGDHGGLDGVRLFLEQVASSPVSQHDAVGLGDELRLDHPDLVGGAIVHEDVVLHLSAFRAKKEALKHPSRSRNGRVSDSHSGAWASIVDAMVQSRAAPDPDAPPPSWEERLQAEIRKARRK